MKFKETIALMAAFIGIVLYYFLIDVPTEKRDKEEKIRSKKVLLFDSGDVEAFSIIKGNNSITLKRSGTNQWQMTSPVDAKGDSATASNFLSSLSILSFTRVVEDSPKDLAIFGLDTPALEITLSLKNGETKKIQVGDNNPMGNKIYLARSGDNKVLTAAITLNSLDRRVYDLRDKTILDFETSQITKLECTRDEKTLTIEKLGDSWKLSEEETTAKGNENEIANFLNTMRAARVKEFIEENPEQLATYGLDNSKLVLKLIGPEASDPITLLIGKKFGSRFYAKTLLGKNVFTVDQTLFDTLNNSRLVDFMDKSLVKFNDNEVARLDLRMDSEAVQLLHDKKDSQKWTIEKPVNAQASTATVNSLLFDLKDTRIVEFVKTFVTNPEPFGLDPPQKELTLTYKNGETWSLTLGNQTLNGDQYFARRTGEEAVFTLKKSAVETIFRSLRDLKDRTLFKFNKENVREIQIAHHQQTFILKKSASKWHLTQPERIDVLENFIGNDILWTLNSLEFETTLPSDPGDTLTGLTHPLLSVKLLDEEGKVLAQLTVGKQVTQSPDLHYLKTDKSPAIYSVKKRILDEIPSSINKFNNLASSG